MFVFRVVLVRIFRRSDWITPNTDTFYAVSVIPYEKTSNSLLLYFRKLFIFEKFIWTICRGFGIAIARSFKSRLWGVIQLTWQYCFQRVPVRRVFAWFQKFSARNCAFSRFLDILINCLLKNSWNKFVINLKSADIVENWYYPQIFVKMD